MTTRPEPQTPAPVDIPPRVRLRRARPWVFRPGLPVRLLPGQLLGLCQVLCLVLCLVLAHSSLGLAATSEACLRRCLSTCPTLDKDGGEACLRSCLKNCPVHCGTVETDCAVDWLKHTPAAREADEVEPVGEPWEATSRRSSAAMRVSNCAEACIVKPDCRPSAYDTGPAELSTTTPVHGGAGLRP